MRRILAIAALAARAAVRSRLVLVLLAILLAAVVGLPQTVQGDGTPEGQLRIMVGYTMGFATAILSLTALWSGALAIAREVDEKQIQMLCSKPVRRVEIWLGKWIGLTAVHAALLGLCALATYGSVQLYAARAPLPDEQRERLHREVLAARRPLPARPPNVEDQARAQSKERLEHHSAPAGWSPESLLNAIREALVVQARTVGPGQILAWIIDLPDKVPGPAVQLQFQFATSQLGLDGVNGVWQAGPPGGTPRFSASTYNRAGRTQTLSMPAETLTGLRELEVRYRNEHSEPVTLVFSTRPDLALLVPAGGFGANFTRAVLIIAATLALLCAIGVTAGTLFSTPVAAFMALAALVIMRAATHISRMPREPVHHHSAGDPRASSMLDSALNLIYQAMDLLVRPLYVGHPLDLVATGQVVEPMALARAVVIQVVLYSGLLAVLAGLVLNRRELALPSS